MEQQRQGLGKGPQDGNGPRAVHPAVAANDAVYKSQAAAQQSAMAANEAQAQLGKVTAERDEARGMANQMDQAMRDPNVDTNVGGLAPTEGPANPVDELLASIEAGVPTEELINSGLVELAMSQLPEDEQAQLTNMLMGPTEANPYGVAPQ